MEWSKAKTLLILLMLAVNLYLGINIYTQLRARTVEEAGMARDACAMLQARGFELDADAILDLPADLRAYTFARSMSAEQKAAGELLGDCAQTQMGGGIYVYDGAAGSVVFRSGGYVELQWTDGTAGDPGLLLAPREKDSRLEMACRDGVYTLRMDGLPVVGAAVSRSHDDTWTGTWVFSSEPAAGSEALPRARLILAAGDLLQENGKLRLESVECVYVLAALQNGDVRLTPAWKIGSGGESWLLSALTGQLVTPA